MLNMGRNMRHKIVSRIPEKVGFEDTSSSWIIFEDTSLIALGLFLKILHR